MCKTVEFFLHMDFIPELSTLFSVELVEKPVENVDNSHVSHDLHRLYRKLCQLVTKITGF